MEVSGVVDSVVSASGEVSVFVVGRSVDSVVSGLDDELGISVVVSEVVSVVVTGSGVVVVSSSRSQLTSSALSRFSQTSPMQA